MKRLPPLTTLLVVGMLVSACADATDLAEGTPPDLPDIQSMEFDFGFFQGGGTPSAAAPLRVAGPHWAAAALSVAAANLAVAIHTAVPVLTLRAAALQVPVFEDGQWHWRFSTMNVNETYAGDLAGYAEDGDLILEMRVSATILSLQDFLWFTGRAPIGGTTGRWEFYDPQTPTTVVGAIDWAHPAADTWEVVFSAVSGPNAGDELSYEVAGNSRTVSFTDASEATTAEVHWDASTSEGYIIAPNYNGGAMSCWDGTLANTTCVP